jgi:hypothetical protein
MLLAAALLAQGGPELTPEEARTAMAWGACFAEQAHALASRAGTDEAIATAVIAACAELERGVAEAFVRSAGPGGRDAALQRLHAGARQQALAVVREARGARPPGGRGAEVETWSYCVGGQVTRRARGLGTVAEIIEAAERDCAEQEAAARVSIERVSGTAAADVEIDRMRTFFRERALALVPQIRSSPSVSPPSSAEPR